MALPVLFLPVIFPLFSFSGYIPVKDLKITYSASSGPGGQNVNKVATKVDLRFVQTLQIGVITTGLNNTLLITPICALGVMILNSDIQKNIDQVPVPIQCI